MLSFRLPQDATHPPYSGRLLSNDRLDFSPFLLRGIAMLVIAMRSKERALGWLLLLGVVVLSDFSPRLFIRAFPPAAVFLRYLLFAFSRARYAPSRQH